MFGINHWELLIVAGLVLLLFGGKRIPSLARSLGQSITEFKRGVKGIDEEPVTAPPEEVKKADV